jgi:hypothetical protein
MAQHTTAEQNSILKACGFRIDTAARRAQAVKNLQTAIQVAADGIWGPLTTNAAETLKNAGWKLSPNFKIQEFACKCGGKHPTCERIKVSPALVKVLQAMRAWYPAGLVLASGYRCPAHNKAVGGATGSQHMQGKAADMRAVLTVAQAQTCGAKGIGYGARSNRVNHVDVRATPAVFVDGI